MSRKLTRIALLLLFALCASHSYSQIVTDQNAPYDTPFNLVQDVLLGEGVKATNIKFYGNAKQIGYFTNGKNSIGIENGIVLSTGNAKQVALPQPRADQDVSTSYPSNTGPNQGKGDLDLQKVAALVPKMLNKPFKVDTTYDSAILEFDFIPSSDSVVFRYVFGSEEYLKWVNTKYNDAFGFFISGPGINGEYSSPAGFPDSSINIATIPGTNIPITVSSVNNTENKNYYVNNPNNVNIVFNGYTTIFTAFARVQPCQTYHIKIAICDGTKDDYDSGVMIEARSFSSGSITLQQTIPVIGVDSAALEGCFGSRIVAKRESVKNYNDTVYVTFKTTSEATAADISPLPPFIVIPAGSDSGVVYFSVVEDNIVEGVEEMELDFHLKSVCSDLHKSFSLKLDDAPALEFRNPQNENIKIKCTENGVFLDARLVKGYGFYNFSWLADGVPMPEDDSVIFVNPSSIVNYTVIGRDTCNIQQVTKSFRVSPSRLAPLSLDLPDTLESQCIGKQYKIQPGTITGGGGIQYYDWTRYGQSIGSDEELTIYPDSSSYYKLLVTDSCGVSAEDSVYLRVQRSFPIQLTASADTTICGEQPLTLSASVTGGSGHIRYNWLSLNDTNQVVTVYPKSTTQFEVQVTDDCQDRKSHTVYVKVNEVHAEFEYSYTGDFGVEVQNYSTGKELSFQWYLDREMFSTSEAPIFEVTDLEDHSLELYAMDSNGCIDTTEEVLRPPLFVYIPNSFTPNGDGINDVYNVHVIDPVEFEMVIFDRWGGIVFKTNDPLKGWNGATPGTNTVTFGTYAVFVKAARKNNIRTEQFGSVTLMP